MTGGVKVDAVGAKEEHHGEDKHPLGQSSDIATQNSLECQERCIRTYVDS